MRCAIVRPRPAGVQWELAEPLGPEAICGYLRRAGVACRVFDRRLGATVDEIQAYGPAAVGFSLMTEEDVPDALRTLMRLQAPGRRFFAGGLLVTCEMARCRALFPSGTVLIPGEGEGPVLTLLTGVPLSRPGPDDWAFAARDDLSAYLARGAAISLRTSRGCRGGCRFCTTPSTAHGRHETRSLSLVVGEMAALAAQGHPPIFNFTDDEFGDLDRIHRLNEGLHRAGLRSAYSLELRPEVVCRAAPEDWRDLHAGGLCRVFTGLESLDRQTLRRWHKPTDPQRLIHAVEECQGAGILCQVGYILFHPESTVASVRAQVTELRRHDLFTPKAALSRLALYPGSALHAESGLRGYALSALEPAVEQLYEQWSAAIGWLYDLWSSCASRLPNAACRRFLDGDNREYSRLSTALDRLNAAAYAAVEGSEISKDEREELHAICRAALLAGGGSPPQGGGLR